MIVQRGSNVAQAQTTCETSSRSNADAIHQGVAGRPHRQSAHSVAKRLGVNRVPIASRAARRAIFTSLSLVVCFHCVQAVLRGVLAKRERMRILAARLHSLSASALLCELPAERTICRLRACLLLFVLLHTGFSVNDVIVILSRASNAPLVSL